VNAQTTPWCNNKSVYFIERNSVEFEIIYLFLMTKFGKKNLWEISSIAYIAHIYDKAAVTWQEPSGDWPYVSIGYVKLLAGRGPHLPPLKTVPKFPSSSVTQYKYLLK